MERIAYVLIIIILIIFMYFQVVRSRDRGQRGRAFERLAKAFDCEFDVGVPQEAQLRFQDLPLGRILNMRYHMACDKRAVPMEFVDVRYSYNNNGRPGIATSTVARFDYTGPVFSCTPDPDPRPLEGEPAGVEMDSTDWPASRVVTGDDPERIREALTHGFERIASDLGQTIVQSDGTQVFVYSWRTRILPHQVPDFLDTVDRVAAALR